MMSLNNHPQKLSLLFLLYSSLLKRMGEKRYYPEILKINNKYNLLETEINNSPTNLVIVKALYELFITVIKRIFQRAIWIEQWFLLFNINDNLSVPYSEYKQIVPPNDRFWADPHIIEKDSKYFVFIEEYIYKQRKACISVIELNKSGEHQSSCRVLEKDYHLSYPHIFQFGETYFMVPESSQNKTIELYECIEFPYRWRFVMNLMNNIIAVDTTLFYYSNIWWLFTAMPEQTEALPKVKLFLFYSEKLLSNEWTAHPQNPIVFDMRTARPAGKISIRDGKIYRPSQDCSTSYGYSINLSEITQLTKNTYIESHVRSIKPNWDKKIKGIHTYSTDDRLTVIDAYRRLPKLFVK
jgi:hypothetical protein